MKNYIKVGFIALVFVFTLTYFGQWLGGRQGGLFGLITALGLIYIIYVVGSQLALGFFKSQEIEGQDPYGLGEIVTKISAKARLPVPKIYLINNNFPTAFASGMTPNNSAVYITSGLTKVLTPAELEAVLAQQIANIKHSNILPAMVGAVLATAFLSLTDNNTNYGSSTTGKIIFSLFAPFALLAVRLHIGRGSFSENDLQASQWIGSPIHLAEALIKLDSYAKTQPPEIPYSMSHLFIVNPLTSKGWGRYFTVHPPVNKRVKKLVGYYPI